LRQARHLLELQDKPLHDCSLVDIAAPAASVENARGTRTALLWGAEGPVEKIEVHRNPNDRIRFARG
jgi:hypothetical protein